MANKKTARRALFSSVLALILCCCMLVGTTFAWFTDEVTTGMNTIAAGNLDIELLRNGDKVEADTKLFNLQDAQGNDTWWEPGMVVYENLQVANVGTLALKYRMTLNFGNENDLNGHKLSEVLKIAVIDKIADDATREEVLAAAKAAVADDQGAGTLANFYDLGELEANTNDVEKTFVIFWEPNDNATDNLYNANNGQITSDGKPLHIEFGVTLEATQMMSERDSFGNDYDEPAALLPKAAVNNTGAQTVKVFKGYSESEIALDTTFQFLPNEAEDVAAVSEYKDWHADYVITADRDVPAESVALAGYYKAWCGDNGWVVLTGPAVEAGEEVRLVAGMMNGTTVSYEEICEYGNDGVGFLCGAADLTGANAGTTITVELRMYEVDPESPTLSTTDSETGVYKVIGTYSYTFPEDAVEVADATELQNALDNGNGNIVLTAGEYKMPSSGTSNNVTITGTKATVLDMTMGAYMDSANVTIKGVTIKTGTGLANGNGSDYAALYTPNVTYVNCTFVGPMRVGRDGAKFLNCTFTELGNDYIWTYGNDVTFEGCTFNTKGKAILIYSDGGNEVANVSVKNCTFNSTEGAKAGAIANQNCAAIEIDNYGNGVSLVTEGNTYDSNFSGEWRIKSHNGAAKDVFVNGTEYTTIALDGKTMTIDAEKNVTVNS